MDPMGLGTPSQKIDVKSSGEFLEHILLYKVLSKNLPPRNLGPKLSMMNN